MTKWSTGDRRDGMSHCVRHYEETTEASCRSCGAPFCGRCLVYSFGPDKPPFCIGCALNAAGVRNSYQVPSAPSPRAERKAARAAARSAASAEHGHRRLFGRRGRPNPAPVAVAHAADAPIPFDVTWSEPADRDIRVPAMAELTDLMATLSNQELGQNV